MLIKDNDTFEEMIETQIELDYVQQPQRSLSYSSSIDNLSSSSENAESSSFEVVDNNELNDGGITFKKVGVTDLITGISFMHNGEYIVLV